MKATGQKLKKLKTRQVYGFKKDTFSFNGGGDPTTVMTTTLTHIMVNPVMQ
jgi:hypothetical protein